MYVDCFCETNKDKIRVVERVNGQRIYQEYDTNYTFYYKDSKGKYTSIFGDRLSKFSTKSYKKFSVEKNTIGKDTFEKDINVVNRCIEDHYRHCEIPELNVCFFDIEVDFDPIHGYSSPMDAQTAVTAITLYMSWAQICITLVLPPPTLSINEATQIANRYENTLIFKTEEELLNTFLDYIEDADVLTGWNSEKYDIPYLINRITRVINAEATSRLCLWGKKPKQRDILDKYGKTSTYEIYGRVHLDYLNLYKKHTYQEQTSYRLDYIGEIEVNENKIQYDGTLDDLYKKDFDKFIEYNKQDVMLLVKIDKKLKFIELSNQLAHQNGVLLKTTLGSVALIEQAIINETHDLGLIICDRKDQEENDVNALIIYDDDDGDKKTVAGAYVADPKIGLNDWIGSIDINSLYPSVIRCLNMGPDTIHAQVRQELTYKYISEKYAELKRREGKYVSHDDLSDLFYGIISNNLSDKTKKASMTECWGGLFSSLEYEEIMKQSDTKLILDIEPNPYGPAQSLELTAKQIYEYVFIKNKNLCISANGTIFDTSKEGIIPGLLRRWYAERKDMKKKAGMFYKMQNGVEIKDEQLLEYIRSMFVEYNINHCEIDNTNDYDLKELEALVEEGDEFKIITYILEYNLDLIDNRIIPNKVKMVEYKASEVLMDMRQHSRKILLNSLYGAILNESCRMFDPRIGQSVTLTGRSVAKHMNGQVNYEFTGIKDYKGAAIQYSDTDSSYFSCIPVLQNEYFKNNFPNFEVNAENIIALYDKIAELVNKSFAPFMIESFHTDDEKAKVIVAGREVVGSRGLFLAKKRYAIMVIDNEGKRYDVNGKNGKIKAMGIETKRSDTPKFIQEFLEDMLERVLCGANEAEVIQMIKDFRIRFDELPNWKKGVPRAIKDFNKYNVLSKNFFIDPETGKKVVVPGHATASLNYMKLRQVFNDNYSIPISNGSKITVCILKPGNNLNMDRIAIPNDLLRIPEWIEKLPYDDDTMAKNLIDKKIKNLIGILKWDLDSSKEVNVANKFFDFG